MVILHSKVSTDPTEDKAAMAKTRILVVEDDDASARLTEVTLKSLGYAVPAVISSGKEAIRKTGEMLPDLVLMDIRLKGDVDGVQAAEEICTRFNIPVIYLTAYVDNEILQRAKLTEPYGYILKPFQTRELHTAIDIALYKHKMDSDLKEKDQALEKRNAELKTSNEQLQRRNTERKHMEEKLRESEEKLRLALNATQDGLWDWDIKTGKQFFSPRWCEIIGYTFDDPELPHIYDSWASRIHPEDYDNVMKSLNSHLEKGTEYDVDYRHLHKSGEYRWQKSIGQAIFDESGKPIRMVGCIRDITEHKRAEEALKESERKYRGLIDTSNDAVITIDSEMKINVWNHAAVKMLGYKEKAMLGKSVMKIVPERFRKAKKSAFAAFIKNGSGPILGKVVEVHGLKKDGTEIPIELSVSATKAGGTYLATGIIRDITERKRIEKRWWDSMANFHKVVGNSADGIIVTSQKGIVQFVNPAAELLFGKKSKAFQGNQFGFPITSGDKTEVDIIRKAGETVVAEMSAVETVWYDKFAYLVTLHDITERKRAEQVLERLNKELQAKVSELEAFSYGIAHDFRSPLVSVEGFSRLLREDMLNHDAEKVQEDIRLLESGVRKMHGFLDRTLEYSRAGQLIKRIKNVSFGKIVKEVIAEFNGQISSIGATVSLADKFPRVCADKIRLTQVMTNLIQNSVKYRDKTIPLKIRIGHRLSKGETVFFVGDNGLGIDAGEADNLFGLFYRGTSDGEGSGIGLAIVKKIIEAHGGRIWAQQGQSGKGTTMCFTLSQKSATNKGVDNGKD